MNAGRADILFYYLQDLRLVSLFLDDIVNISLVFVHLVSGEGLKLCLKILFLFYSKSEKCLFFDNVVNISHVFVHLVSGGSGAGGR